MTETATQGTATSKKISFNLSTRTYAYVTIALLVVLFFALNVFFNATVRSTRYDLTENNLFTLSTGTINSLHALEEPISIQFFYSETLAAQYPQVRSYGGRVRDMLEEYEAHAGDKLKIEFIDPQPYTEAEDLANANGLQGAQTPDGELLYFGLVGTNTLDGREVIPFFAQDRAPFLEYDLTELIYRLNTVKKPVLGVVTSLPLDTGVGGLQMAMQGRARPLLIYEQLRQKFDVEMLDQDFDAVPKTVDVLMIAHPKELADTTLYAIDQFVLKGGRALVFVDPFSETSQQRGPMGQPMPGATQSSNLAKLFDAWGIAYDPEKVVADRGIAQVVQTMVDGRRTQLSYPVWLGVTPEQIDTGDLITADIKQLNFGSAGAISQKEGATTEFRPLITTTADSGFVEKFAIMFQPRPEEILRNFQPTEDSYTIAARIVGDVESAYKDGAPKPEKKADDADKKKDKKAEKPKHLAKSASAINVIVVADSDLFKDDFWVVEQNLLGQRIAVPTADNANFVLNAVENLMGSNDLISLRSRASGERPFTLVEDIRRKAEAQFLAREQALQQRLEETRTKLRQLQGQEDSGLDLGASIVLTPEQERELEEFRRVMIEIRTELREVQRGQRADIEALGTTLAIMNIALVPFLVAAAAIGLAFWRRRSAAQGAGSSS